ncbi:hypothetical protein C8R47DRAFT_1096550 [Mycena vitilis]|nr:hypothetical protein C8R47DRAFT_1096550 [Mycena vitilis]
MELQRPTPKDLALRALQSNQEHQYALAQYANKLAAELAELDKLLSQADTEDAESDLECDFYIPNAKPPVGPIRNLNHPKSPFYEDTMRRTRYLGFTVRHPMPAKDVEVLRVAVEAELKRVEQLDGASSTTTDVEMANRLNWTIIAEKVSDASNIRRTAQECKIKWIGDLSTINRGAWSALESQTLQNILKKRTNKRSVNWIDVARELGTNRLPMDCMRQAIERPRYVWTVESDQKLVDAVKQYGLAWSLVAKYVGPDVTAGQCSARFLRTLDPSLRRGPWTADEDKRLVAAVSGYGKAAWSEVASVMPGRTNEQCRDRWTSTLDPAKISKTAEEWGEEKEKALLEAVATHGRKWKLISAQLGRTAASCRIRYDALKEQDVEPNSPLAGPSTYIGPPTVIEGDVSRAKKVQPQAPIDTPVVSKPARPRPRALPKNKKRAASTPEPEEATPRKKRATQRVAGAPEESTSQPVEDASSSDLVSRIAELTTADTSSPSPGKGGKRRVLASSLPRRRSARLAGGEGGET